MEMTTQGPTPRSNVYPEFDKRQQVYHHLYIFTGCVVFVWHINDIMGLSALL